MRRTIGRLLKGTKLEAPARYALALAQSFRPGQSQSNEKEILDNLTRQLAVPKTFVEFGFHWHQFNCIGLMHEFSGLLIDGSAETVALAKRLLPRKIEIEACFLTLDNIGFIEERFRDRPLGILSIDVDGNDYWFLKRLLPMRPAIIAIEYNASFLLRRLTVPYKLDFERHKEHPSGWYCGASLTAISRLCEDHGYSLVAISASGVNAFFVRNDLLTPAVVALSAQAAYRECVLSNMWSGTTAAEQWSVVEHLEFVEV
jgi:hypothetical protein